jgi:predicted nucleic acid-binding protein
LALCEPKESATVADHILTGAIVPDTSVILKWYLREQEPDRERALALLDAYLEGQVHLVAPDLLPYEVANVLRYKPDWDAVRVAQVLDSLFALRLEFVPLSITTLHRAVDLAYTHNIAVYDAAFLALAEGSGAVFVTADEGLVRRTQDRPQVCPLTKILPASKDSAVE